MKKFYLTTAIPYVNGKPHMGHALEYFQADAVRRYHAIRGEKTLLLSGADENALKNVQAAEKEGIPVEEFLARNSFVFKEAFARLGVPLDVFQRGSDKRRHWPGVQRLWQLCFDSGDIYKKSYTGLYCVGCESFKTEKELVNGLCPEHLRKPEVVSEENYFFALSRYQDRLIQLIESKTLDVTPENKRTEILSFIKQGLEDFSVSRSKERARGIGVPVPDDPDQVMYVWFDALAIYMTGVGFGVDEDQWKTWWPADLHVIGKDINRFHTVYWPAMLLSAGLALPKQVLIHSFILSHGQKMSKSLGNVIDPFAIAQEYGIEPFRYYLLSQIPIDSDGDFTLERFQEVYTADLANGLGNLVSRIAKLCETIAYQPMGPKSRDSEHVIQDEEYVTAFSEYRFSDACAFVWKKISDLDKYLNEEKPWEILKSNSQRATGILAHCVDRIQEIAILLDPILPGTSGKILEQFKGPTINAQKPLFPRLK
jgi:methionyl-tRNA synthetase